MKKEELVKYIVKMMGELDQKDLELIFEIVQRIYLNK